MNFREEDSKSMYIWGLLGNKVGLGAYEIIKIVCGSWWEGDGWLMDILGSVLKVIFLLNSLVYGCCVRADRLSEHLKRLFRGLRAV